MRVRMDGYGSRREALALQGLPGPRQHRAEGGRGMGMSEHPITKAKREYTELLERYGKAKNRIFHNEREIESLQAKAEEQARKIEAMKDALKRLYQEVSEQPVDTEWATEVIATALRGEGE